MVTKARASCAPPRRWFPGAGPAGAWQVLSAISLIWHAYVRKFDPPAQRIEKAKAKMERVLDHFLYLLELQANNKHVVYSLTLASQIQTSYAANAFRNLADPWFRTAEISGGGAKYPRIGAFHRVDLVSGFLASASTDFLAVLSLRPEITFPGNGDRLDLRLVRAWA
jgi:hypothetical protein